MKANKSNFCPFWLLLLVALFGFNNSQAQRTKKDVATEKQIIIKNLVDSRNYVFRAQSVTPLRGRTRQLSSDYDIRVMGDSMVTYLPYFGRAYSAPIDPSEDGIKLNTTNFDYKAIARKKGGWEISILPKENSDVRQLLLTVSANGYAQLQVTSNNRDIISFNGYIEELKTRK
jgi:hypothetical protein